MSETRRESQRWRRQTYGKRGLDLGMKLRWGPGEDPCVKERERDGN